MAELHVELVAVDREVWSGEATQVTARTTEGEIGILPHHAPLLGQLADGGVVTIYQGEGSPLLVAVHGGFLSVTEQGVTILAEVAELAPDIDAGRAREALERARREEDIAAQRRAESRLRAAGQPA